jgi:hypothetical protein
MDGVFKALRHEVREEWGYTLDDHHTSPPAPDDTSRIRLSMFIEIDDHDLRVRRAVKAFQYLTGGALSSVTIIQGRYHGHPCDDLFNGLAINALDDQTHP